MLSRDVLRVDAAEAVDLIESAIRDEVRADLRRRGAVVGLSGGVDSSLVAALCARALGPANVLGVLMPDKDSSDDALRLGRAVADRLEIEYLVEDVTASLAAIGCYERQNEAIRSVVPQYGDEWRCKLIIPPLLDGDRLNVVRLTVADADGAEDTVRLTSDAYRQLVAATNFKQRVRAMVLYYHADRLHYAVAGTPNRLEYDQGFFVKQGDGAADFKPIAHLYKSQVYQLAEFVGVPDEILARPPTTDTFSLPQTQEEFYFALPYRETDLCLWALDHDLPAAEVAPAVGLASDQVDRIFRDLRAKRRAARSLHHVPRPLNDA